MYFFLLCVSYFLNYREPRCATVSWQSLLKKNAFLIFVNLYMSDTLVFSGHNDECPTLLTHVFLMNSQQLHTMLLCNLNRSLKGTTPAP